MTIAMARRQQHGADFLCTTRSYALENPITTLMQYSLQHVPCYIHGNFPAFIVAKLLFSYLLLQLFAITVICYYSYL
jgi:hypothetical protein